MGNVLQYCKKEFNITLEIKKSKFITYICPYDDFDTMMQRLKAQHPKARHFVYAYRFLNELEQIVENCSDDGEPKGTSGRPSLKVLNGAKIINTAVIIVRYFGGIRLGTGGLVKAYSDAVNLAVDEADFFIYEKLETLKLKLPYSSLGQVEYLLESDGIIIFKKEFEIEVILTLVATLDKFINLKDKLSQDIKIVEQ